MLQRKSSRKEPRTFDKLVFAPSDYPKDGACKVLSKTTKITYFTLSLSPVCIADRAPLARDRAPLVLQVEDALDLLGKSNKQVSVSQRANEECRNNLPLQDVVRHEARRGAPAMKLRKCQHAHEEEENVDLQRARRTFPGKRRGRGSRVQRRSRS